MGFFTITLKTFSYIYQINKKKLLVMILLAFMIGLADLLGIASIYPFMSVATSSNFEPASFPFNLVSEFSGLSQRSELVFAFGVITSLIILVAMSIKILGTAYIIKFSLDTEYEMSKKLFRIVTEKNYDWHRNGNRAKNEKLILNEVTNFVHQAVYPLTLLVVHAIIIIMILGLLVYIQPIAAFSIGITFFAIYGLITVIVKKKLTIIGRIRTQANENKFRIVGEAFDLIKLIKLYKMEEFHRNNFEGAAREYSDRHAQSQIIGQLPRFFVEMIALILTILVVSYVQLKDTQNFINSIPIISIFCLGAFKVLPSAQQLYFSISQLSYSEKVVEEISVLLDHSQITPKSARVVPETDHKLPKFEKFELLSKDSGQKILFELGRGKSIGLIGKSGGGKTTFLESLAGLIETEDFIALYNGDRLIGDLQDSRWHEKLAYVPQEPFLMSGTIQENVCFGLPIDEEKVLHVCKLAMLEGFLLKRTNGIESEIGRFGSQLSGGEKQRIAVARALYRDKEILLMDEGTSALDDEFEDEIISNLLRVEDLSLVIISHSKKVCNMLDHVYEIETDIIRRVSNA